MRIAVIVALAALVTACTLSTLPTEELRARLVGRLDAQGIINIHVEPVYNKDCDGSAQSHFAFRGYRVDDISKTEMYGFACLDATDGSITGISIMQDRTFPE